MYEYLKGILAEIGAGFVVLDVNGLGYHVNVPSSDISGMPHIGEHLKLYVHLAVREDARDLYGFIDKSGKAVFEKLLTVSGIGPKAALSALSIVSPERLVLAIAASDEKLLSTVPGIGKKTAQRIVLELKDKMHIQIKNEGAANLKSAHDSGSVETDAVQALLALGYDASEAFAAVKAVNDPKLDLTQLIKRALRALDSR
jgi:Holliday junction DNA helicase RuvA